MSRQSSTLPYAAMLWLGWGAHKTQKQGRQAFQGRMAEWNTFFFGGAQKFLEKKWTANNKMQGTHEPQVIQSDLFIS